MTDGQHTVCCVATNKGKKRIYIPPLAGHIGMAAAVLGMTLTPLTPVYAETSHSASDLEQTATDRAESARQAVERMFQDPLGGVVVNRTVTVLGKDFYRYFAMRWRQSAESNRYTISIHERPTARFGSEIWVQYRQERIFHIFLPPARQATRKISEIAVQQVLENISRRELERLTTWNPDLGPEEL